MQAIADPLAALDGIAQPSDRRFRSALRICGLAGGVAVAVFFAHAEFGLGGGAVNGLTQQWLYDGVITGAAVSCLARAKLRGSERVFWLLVGLALAFVAASDIYGSLVFGARGSRPTPSFQDVLYLPYYPLLYAALVLLLRSRIAPFRAGAWLDAGIAAAASAAAAIAAAPIVLGGGRGGSASLATNMTYPLGDLVLLGILLVVFALSGWRPGRTWLLLGLGLALCTIADTGYAYAETQGNYGFAGLLDSLWLLSALTIAVAAWQMDPRPRKLAFEAPRLLAVPVAFALVALSVLLGGGFAHVRPAAIALAGVALVLVIVRAAWTLTENVRLLEASKRDAFTDGLTGLGNHRSMTAALARAVATSRPLVLAMFDLDGFKQYNDRFGHGAGDALLADIAGRLQVAVAGVGAAYRPGGDEFCVLVYRDRGDPEWAIAAAAGALSAVGDGFVVSSSYGTVAMPQEAPTAAAALGLADERMYEHKRLRRRAVARRRVDPVQVPA